MDVKWNYIIYSKTSVTPKGYWPNDVAQMVNSILP